MNRSEKFMGFLESLKDGSNESLIESVKEAFVLTEASVRGLQFPDVQRPERRRLPSAGKPLSAEEQAANSAKFKREQGMAKQAGGRASGAMAQVAKYAMTAPLDIEKWMNEVLKPAIKAGKKDIDAKFGTDSAKVGFGQRIKNMGKAMLGEGTEVDYTDDYEPEIDEDEEEISGFQSNKGATRLAKQRRKSLAEGTEVDYSENEAFEDEDFEDEEEIGGFKSNKETRREANMRRGSLKN